MKDNIDTLVIIGFDPIIQICPRCACGVDRRVKPGDDEILRAAP